MTEFNDIPPVPHFAIITEVSVHIPGDERSRTNPGHGYPAHTETYISYRAFADQNNWEAAVAAATQRGERFHAVSVSPAKVTTTVTVGVET
jgi:hypothetical protein